MKALLIAAAACAALFTVPAMAASAPHRSTERIEIFPLTPAEAASALPADYQTSEHETYSAQVRVAADPSLMSALQAQGVSPDRVLDIGQDPDGQVNIYVSG